MKFSLGALALVITALLALPSAAQLRRNLGDAPSVEIINQYGKIEAVARPVAGAGSATATILSANSATRPVVDSEIVVRTVEGRLIVEVKPSEAKKRIDVEIEMPARSVVRLRAGDAPIVVSGDFASVDAQTETGTVAADLPLASLDYNFIWTASRPRYVADVVLAETREKTAGRFVVAGRVTSATPKSNYRLAAPVEQDSKPSANVDPRQLPAASNVISVTTSRGIVLLNVPPNEMPSDLRERPLTKAAKAIIRSGDSMLTEAIRRAAPKYFADYAATLPPMRFEPTLTLRADERPEAGTSAGAGLKRVLVRVTDAANRAVPGLAPSDFELSERGTDREIVAVEPATAPFNLVLLLDVSGSVESYVDFIRKAARAFVTTAGKEDRVAIIIFNDDVKQLSTFSTQKGQLSESLDTFDAGGSTAYYDALAYVLAETLRPLRGERTAIVVLTDGDDNRSFLSFDALTGSIQESGALIYPLYVPSGLVAASGADLTREIDPLRAKYMNLTSKAQGEGEKLAQISGGVYYPITQLTQIQKAYDDIVAQLRTAYSVTFKSDAPDSAAPSAAASRIKVHVKKENAFVKLGTVTRTR